MLPYGFMVLFETKVLCVGAPAPLATVSIPLNYSSPLTIGFHIL